MHTKEELVEKKTRSQQLNLVDEVSNIDKIAKKRKHLILAIIATIGLSLLFWLARVSQYYFNHPASLIPHISLKIPQKTNLFENLESQINQIVFSQEVQWNISIAIDSTIFNWSKNKIVISNSDLISARDILIVKKNNSSKIALYLPQGLNIKENLVQNQKSLSLQSLITLPRHQIIFFINYSGPNQNFPPTILPQLISSLYWTIVPTLTN